MTRWLTALAGAAVLLLGGAAPAAAHGFGVRLDLPVPISLFVYGAATVLVVSFVALGVLWKRPRLEDRPPGRPLPVPVQRVARSPVAEAIVRSISVALFLVVFAAAAGGRDVATLNLAPRFVYVWLWVGLAFTHALLGNWWATLSPWDSIARFLGIGNRPRRPYPAGWGVWPAAILLFGFVWMELVLPSGFSPRVLAVAIIVYTAVTLTGMSVFGRERWNRSGEAFAVYFRLLSLIAPMARDEEGRVVVRPPSAGLPTLEPRPGLVALVMVILGSTTFDGFSGTTLWIESIAGLGTVARTLAGTTALLAAVLMAAALYALAMLAASAVAGTAWHPLAVRFVHSLVPIAFAYVAAHYFSLLVLEGQAVFALISDPFGLGWDLFGTVTYSVNFGLLSAVAIWYVQVAAIVTGHVAGVVLAHDRSLAQFPGSIATRTQYALLAVMVLFTIGGLLILSGG